MKLFAAIAAVCLAVPAMGQGVRYDHRVATIATNYPAGAQVPVMAIPNAQVTICVDGNCGALAPIFSNQTLTVRTSNPMQADGQGNFGFWAAGGTYFYKVVEPSGKVDGIFPFTLGGAGGSSAVTQIIEGAHIHISPTNGLGAVTINADGGPVVEVNGTPLTTPSPVNFEDSASVTFTNPSEGVIQAEANLGLAMQVVPPIAGQFVVIYPTSGTVTNDQSQGTGVNTIDTRSATLFYQCSTSLCTPGVTSARWTGFSLPSFVVPANVTAVYGFSVSSATALGPMAAPSILCTGGPVAPNTFGWTMQQGTGLLSGVTGSNIASVNCDSLQDGSVSGLKRSVMNVATVGLIVYYTGTAPPVSSALNVVPPLFLNTAVNELGIDPASLGGAITLASVGAGASPTGLFDFSAATHIKLPSRAGYTAAASGEIGYDTTNLNLHFNIANTDLLAVGFPSASGLPVNGHCMQWTIIGAWLEATDAGAPCGSGGGSGISGGTAGFVPLFGSATTITGSSHLNELTAGVDTFTQPVAVNDGTGKAGAIGLLAGTAPLTAPANTVQINAPASVTPYAINLPGAQPTAGNTRLDCTAANPAVCTWAAAGGGGGTTTIASGTSALGTSAIASATCATVVTTTATGTASTDAIIWNPNASIKAVTGYVPATTGGLSISGFPTTNAVNWDVCNWTAASITPGAVTLNWRVVR